MWEVKGHLVDQQQERGMALCRHRREVQAPRKRGEVVVEMTTGVNVSLGRPYAAEQTGSVAVGDA